MQRPASTALPRLGAATPARVTAQPFLAVRTRLSPNAPAPPHQRAARWRRCECPPRRRRGSCTRGQPGQTTTPSTPSATAAATGPTWLAGRRSVETGGCKRRAWSGCLWRLRGRGAGPSGRDERAQLSRRRASARDFASDVKIKEARSWDGKNGSKRQGVTGSDRCSVQWWAINGWPARAANGFRRRSTRVRGTSPPSRQRRGADCRRKYRERVILFVSYALRLLAERSQLSSAPPPAPRGLEPLQRPPT